MVVEVSPHTREELAEELRDVATLYFVGIHYARRGAALGWTRFRVYYVKDGRLKQLWFPSSAKEVPPHWVPPHKTRSGRWVGGYFECKAVGMDRCFHIAYELGRWLYGDGYKFEAEFLSWEE